MAGTTMQRDGKMRNGMAPDNSYGKSGTAKFLDGGGKAGAHMTLGKGHAVMVGAGYEWKTPAPRTAFAAAQINNDFVKDLKQEKILSGEAGLPVAELTRQAEPQRLLCQDEGRHGAEPVLL